MWNVLMVGCDSLGENPVSHGAEGPALPSLHVTGVILTFLAQCVTPAEMMKLGLRTVRLLEGLQAFAQKFVIVLQAWI